MYTHCLMNVNSKHIVFGLNDLMKTNIKFHWIISCQYKWQYCFFTRLCIIFENEQRLFTKSFKWMYWLLMRWCEKGTFDTICHGISSTIGSKYLMFISLSQILQQWCYFGSNFNQSANCTFCGFNLIPITEVINKESGTGACSIVIWSRVSVTTKFHSLTSQVLIVAN